jgi:Zn-dependent protease with chaperone function
MSSTQDPSTGRLPAGPSLAGRFAAAIALTIGFFTLAILIIALLLVVAVVPWLTGHPNLFVTLPALVLAWTVLTGVVPRRLHFSPPGPRLTAEDQPRLHALVREEAQAAGERMPDEVYATLDAQAAVTQHGRRRMLILGLPLLHILTERQLRAVVAHELGHYTGGDTRLGPWLQRTYDMIGRTLHGLATRRRRGQEVVRKPFEWYAHRFLRITAAIKRRQEFAADACAALHAGRDVHVAALRRVHAYAPAFDGYWRAEVAPVLEAGRRPPVSDGFGRFIAHDSIRRAAEEHLQQELAAPESDPYDTHPSLPERIAAVADLPAGEPDTSPCAIGLLEDAAGLERRALALLFGEEAANLETVDWDEVPRAVWLEHARALPLQFSQLLDGVTAGTLADAVGRLPETAARLTEAGQPAEDAAEIVAATLADGLLVALAEDGWEVVAAVGDPVAARRGDEVVMPRQLVAQLRAGELDAASWRERAQGLGIAELPLGEQARTPQPA